ESEVWIARSRGSRIGPCAAKAGSFSSLLPRRRASGLFGDKSMSDNVKSDASGRANGGSAASSDPQIRRRQFLTRAASVPALFWIGGAFGQTPNPPTDLRVDG